MKINRMLSIDDATCIKTDKRYTLRLKSEVVIWDELHV